MAVSPPSHTEVVTITLTPSIIYFPYHQIFLPFKMYLYYIVISCFNLSYDMRIIPEVRIKRMIWGRMRVEYIKSQGIILPTKRRIQLRFQTLHSKFIIMFSISVCAFLKKESIFFFSNKAYYKAR